MIRTNIPLGDYFKVSVLEHHEERYEIGILFREYPNILSEYELDEHELQMVFGSPDVHTVTSKMQVYGAMQDIFNYLKNEYPSLMKNCEGVF